MLTKPYSDIADEAFDPANYPACKLRISFEQEPSAGRVYDEVSGTYLEASAATATWTPTADGGALSTVNSISYTLPNAIAHTTGLFTLLVVSATLDAAGGVRGTLQNATAANGKIDIASALNSFIFDDAAGVPITATDTPTASLAGTRELWAAGFVAGGGTTGQLKTYKVLDPAGTTSYTATAGNSTRDLNNNSYDRLLLTANAPAGVMHSVMVFQFTGVPSDIRQALTWMSQNNGVYPGWKGRS